ncbi:bifunctional lysylphosphatidylglycerol flippase/synthetase MprF [Exiguobacterium sp. s122]|uniref:bifunctional lysylphosphatidylglycerol flippase/synthetase MprF n=3 Tax=Exiguobacterium TaxID=33986 RepID=UPI001BEA2E0C|nr:bifunctional lysylphosphatidylglycerol flippase/synthetase MprF [Exiguobacterium sp. s122]
MHKRMSWKQLKWLIPFLLIGLILYQSGQELRQFSLAAAFQTLKSLTGFEQFTLILLGLVAVLTMTGYDYFLLKSLQVKIKPSKLIQAAWITNSMNGMLGFGGVIGIALRTSLYRPYLDTLKLLRAIGWMTPTLISGLSLLSFGVVLGLFPAATLTSTKQWIWPALLVTSALLPFYLTVTRRRSNLSWTTLAGYVATSFFEWLSAGAVALYALFLLGGEAPLTSLFGVFIVATTIGVLSLVPGGIGSFDLLYLVGMTQLGINQEIVLSSLIVYRFVYFIVPFMIGLFLSAIVFGNQVVKQIEYKPIIGSSYEIGTVVWRIVSRLLVKAGRLAGGLIALMTSLLIWFQTLLPSVTPLYATPLWMQWGATVLFLAAGILMLLSGYGMYRRTKRVQWVVFVSFLFAFIGIFGRGANLFEVFAVTGFALFVWLTRHQHDRYRSIMTPGRFFRSAVYVSLYVGTHALLLQSFSQTDAIFLDQDAAAFLSLSATLLAGIAMLAVFFTFSRLKRPQLGETFEASRFEAFQAAHTTAATYDLAHMGDKRVYYGEEDAACLLFASAGNHAIVFGDVQGDRQAASELLATFLEETDRFGYVPLFYQVTPDWMPRLHDAGFTFFKLGEEATVDVGSFSLAGKKRSNMRALNNQFSRNGFTFEVVSNPDQTLIEALRPISDDWLGNRKEKGFSLGFFNEVALPHYRTALLRNEAGEIVAFITLLQGTGQVSIDLMRVKQDAPAGTMEVLILYVIEWARTEAFERVGLGMAPLASVGEQPFSYWPERVAADVFENISYIYPFSGLRQFKHKFSPTWDARYLAIRKRRKLLPSLLRTARLISRKR